MEAILVANTPEQVQIARLMTLKQCVRLEAVGLRHSSGKSMKRLAARELGLRPNAHIDDVIGALTREIDRRLASLQPQQQELNS